MGLKKFVIATTLMVGMVGAANAAVMNFNSDTSFHFGDGTPYQEAGFQLSNSYSNGYGQVFWGTEPYNADPSGNTYSHNFGSSTTTLIKIGGGSFYFNSIDLTDVYNKGNGGDVQFNFLFADNTNSQQIVSLVAQPGLHTFTFNQANLTALSWTPLTTEGPWIQVDNIVLDANQVPEPASLILVGLGLAGLARAYSKTKQA